MSTFGVATIALGSLLAADAAAAELPDAIAAPGAATILEVQAVGAQIYECKADGAGKLAWRFREPIAALIQDGKTVGRHYAGPTWQIGNSLVTGKVVGHAPGASAKDIAWLKLEAADHQGGPLLSEATIVQRIHTVGGNMEGDCLKEGELRAEPYAADYVFLKAAQ
jgi:Protein of unknown function (DUF3455)